MRKLFVLTGIVLYCSQVFAGGLLTNGNQSSQYIRMLSRNASTDVDAVYFNPAGLMMMENGFYFALQNQSLYQYKTVESTFPSLNSGKYDGLLSAPVFPTAYAVYKNDRFAFSLGFGPNSGGGSATFNRGLPSFENQISTLVPSLAGLSQLGLNVTKYNTDIYFKGTSVFWGIQGGASFKVNKVLSVYAGARYVPATNKYSGYIKNIQLDVNGQYTSAAPFLTGTATQMQGLAAQASGAAILASGAAAEVQPLITNGAGSFTIAQVEGAGYLSAANAAQLQQGLAQLGLSQAQISQMNISQVQGAFSAGAATLNGEAAALNSQATTLNGTAAQLADKNVDVTQTGSGITPILGVNISPAKGLNIGIKYEFMTKLTLTNSTKVDNTNLFPNNAKTGSDLPSILSIGADYKISKLTLSLSFNSYDDKGVDWGTNIYGEQRTIAHNTWESALGAQYQLTRKFAVSAGYLRTVMGVTPQFQSDFSFINNGANTFACGIQWKPTPKITVDAGGLYTGYSTDRKTFPGGSDINTTGIAYTESYTKHNIGFTVGLAYHIGKM